ncbi:hypothetical protein ACFL6R_01935 [Gemmatimonadota bacterium]
MNTVLMAVLLCMPVGNRQQTAGFRDFIYQERKDPVTDLNASIIFTFEKDSPTDRTGQLAWMMSGASVQIYLHAGQYLDDDPVRVIWKFDDNEPVESEWKPSEEGKAVFLPVVANNRFTLEAYAADRVVIEAFDSAGTPHTYTFSMSGLQAAYRTMTGYLVSPDSVSDVVEGFTISEGIISVRSNNTAVDSVGILSWQNRDGSLEISLTSGFDIQSDSEATDLLIGFDGGDQYNYPGKLSDDHTSATITGQSAEIITAMAGTAGLITITVSQPDRQHIYRFSISGLSAALLQIRPLSIAAGGIWRSGRD